MSTTDCSSSSSDQADLSVVPHPVQVIEPDIKTVHVIINNNKIYVFSRDILLSFPQTYLGYRATKLTDYADVIINKDIIEIHVHYTELYFKYVQAWYYTAQLYVPTPQEADLFHQVLDFWLIPHKNEMLDMTGMIADAVGMKFDKVIEAFAKITENLRGPMGNQGPIGYQGPMGNQGPRGTPGMRGPIGPSS